MIDGFFDDFLTFAILENPAKAAAYYNKSGLIPSREGGFSEPALAALRPHMPCLQLGADE